jgi:hypothetical protein
MKKNLLIIISVVVLYACDSAPKKVTGTVKKFEPSIAGVLTSTDPLITFTDGRTLRLKNMPERTVEVGSKIAVWYHGENAEFIFNDSITIMKPASLVTALITRSDLFPDTIGLPLSHGDFELLVSLVVNHGVKMAESDCQYIYLDKLGNRHTMISIRRTDGRANSKAPVSQISVWVSGKNKPESDIMFSYIIKPAGIEFAGDADLKVIKTAIHSLLVMARK